MKKLLSRLIWLPIGFVFVMFLVANRQPVAISLDPISVEHPAITTPALWLWFWLVLAFLIGFFAGAAGMWMSSKSGRQKARAEHRELKALKKELAAAPKRAAPPDALPSLQAH
ncbi:MAG TPA: LapA family protein [Parvularculaceae bacterium]|nr:LapA family protein [Parvularculaceae bacterium]